MLALTASEMLALWERGATCHPIDRSVLLTSSARPDLAPDAVADLPLGRVTTCLLALHTATFGSRMAGHVDCERCGQRLELALDSGTLLEAAPGWEGDAPPQCVQVAGRRLRPPSLRDLAAVVDEPNAAAAARRLLDLCTVADDGAPVGDGMLREIEDALEALEPNADLAISMRCVACGHENDAELDVGAFLWDEVAACARRLLGEVHRLALAYGWTESEILALSPARRAGYLALVSP